MSRPTPTIAIVDDEISVCTGVQRLVRSAGWSATSFTSGAAFLASLDALDAETPDCVILDIVMPGISGLEVLTQIRARGLKVLAIFISAEERMDVGHVEATSGPTAFLHKPFEGDQLIALIRGSVGEPPSSTTSLQ